MQKLPKLHLLSDPKSEKEAFSRIYRLGDYVYAQTGQNAAKFSALLFGKELLAVLPEQFSLHATEWKLLADGFKSFEYRPEDVRAQLQVTDKNGKLNVLRLDDVSESTASKLEVPYIPDRKPLPEGDITQLAICPKWLSNVGVACSRRGGVGLLTFEPLAGIDDSILSVKVLIEEPNEFFLDAVIVSDYRELEPVSEAEILVDLTKIQVEIDTEKQALLEEAIDANLEANSKPGTLGEPIEDEEEIPSAQATQDAPYTEEADEEEDDFDFFE